MTCFAAQVQAASSEAPAETDAQVQGKKFARLQQTPEERSAPVRDIVSRAEESLQGMSADRSPPTLAKTIEVFF